MFDVVLVVLETAATAEEAELLVLGTAGLTLAGPCAAGGLDTSPRVLLADRRLRKIDRPERSADDPSEGSIAALPSGVAGKSIWLRPEEAAGSILDTTRPEKAPDTTGPEKAPDSWGVATAAVDGNGGVAAVDKSDLETAIRMLRRLGSGASHGLVARTLLAGEGCSAVGADNGMDTSTLIGRELSVSTRSTRGLRRGARNSLMQSSYLRGEDRIRVLLRSAGTAGTMQRGGKLGRGNRGPSDEAGAYLSTSTSSPLSEKTCPGPGSDSSTLSEPTKSIGNEGAAAGATSDDKTDESQAEEGPPNARGAGGGDMGAGSTFTGSGVGARCSISNGCKSASRDTCGNDVDGDGVDNKGGVGMKPWG